MSILRVLVLLFVKVLLIRLCMMARINKSKPVKGNNNKVYGLGKERELKRMLRQRGDVIEVTRARGSFGMFDIQAFSVGVCYLYSVKSVRQRYWSFASELRKLRDVEVPHYCKKLLAIYWSPCAGREKRGWELLLVD